METCSNTRNDRREEARTVFSYGPTILGIRFTDLPVEVLSELVLRGGLTVVPSGPGLAVDLLCNAEYRRALVESDHAVTDSGAMVLFWQFFRGRPLRRISGLRLLEHLLKRPELRAPGRVFWVHPDSAQRSRNEDWLRQFGFVVTDADGWTAPRYPPFDLADEDLLERLRIRRPRVVVLCIGGGVQERLGWWLREQYRQDGEPCPAIICTGAAIGFLSGNQVRIPAWADRLCLGWLWRCLSDPRRFVPRYWSALPLAYLIARYMDRLPPMRPGPNGGPDSSRSI